MKPTCVSQHCALKVLLLMWSSPAALVKLKLSASKISNVPKSFFSHAAYHLRIISSFVKFCPPHALPLAGSGMLRVTARERVPVGRSFLRDTDGVVTARFPSSAVLLHGAPG